VRRDSNFKQRKREAFEVTSPRSCGERSPGEAQRRRADEGLSPRAQFVERAPHPALSPRRAGRGRRESAALRSRGTMRPSFAKQRPSKIRGRGECRVPNAPAASCALCSWSMHTSIHSGGTGNIRHSARDGFTAYIALSPGTGLSCPRRPRDNPATLTPASGRQDHTTSPSAPAPLVLRRRCVHRIPLPTSVTIAIRPSCGGGTAGRLHNFCFSEREIFLRGELRTQIRLNPLAKLDFT
jgi:hypothetical protein